MWTLFSFCPVHSAAQWPSLSEPPEQGQGGEGCVLRVSSTGSGLIKAEEWRGERICSPESLRCLTADEGGEAGDVELEDVPVGGTPFVPKEQPCSWLVLLQFPGLPSQGTV